MSDFGKRLKQAMDEREMTASDLSKASGVSKSLISYYLSGKCLAKQDKIYNMAKVLGVDPGWLMTGVEQKSEHESRLAELPRSELITKIIVHMAPLDYETVMEALIRTEKRMKEEGNWPYD